MLGRQYWDEEAISQIPRYFVGDKNEPWMQAGRSTFCKRKTPHFAICSRENEDEPGTGQ